MEVGLGPRELMGSDGGGEGIPAARSQVVVEEGTGGVRQASHIVDVEIGGEEPAAAVATARDDTQDKTALAVAATAAVELTNLFFLLRGGTERHRGWTAGGIISTLFAFAAFLSAAGLLIARNAAGRGKAVVPAAARRRVILVASAAALFAASAGTALSLLRAQGAR